MTNTFITKCINDNVTIIMEDRKLNLVFTKSELEEFIDDLIQINIAIKK